jgi:hypothetical protein
MNKPLEETINSNWKGFYKLAGVATLVMVLFFLFDVIIWSLLGPYPNSAEEWFTLFEKNRTVGFLLLSFPTLFGMILYYLTFLGLYNILKKVNAAYAALAVLFAFVGLSILLVTNMAYPLIHLSNQYAVTSIEAKRVLLLAAGESKIATTSIGMNLGGFLVEGVAVIFSILMLRSNVFGKKLAYLGILGHGLDFIRIILTLTFLPEVIGTILLMIGGLPQLIWLILVGLRFIKLAHDKGDV